MMPAEKPTTKMGNNRRNNKPIMEKRRRARINSCLNDLKALILEALKKDPSRHSKLEKADILEMTVKHLQNLQRQQVALSAASNPCISNKFRAGFDECATEVQRYLNHMDGLDPCVQQRLVGHLTHCAKSLHEMPPVQHTGSMSIARGSLPSSPQPQAAKQSCNRTTEVTANAIVNGLHLVPTRLPNGDLAFLLPGSYALGTGTHSMDAGSAICLVNSTTGCNNDVDVTSTGATVVTHVLAPQLVNSSSTLPTTWQSPDESRTNQVMAPCDSDKQTSSAFISPNSRVSMGSEITSFHTRHVLSVTSETTTISPPGFASLPQIGSEDACHDISGCSNSDQEPWRPW